MSAIIFLFSFRSLYILITCEWGTLSYRYRAYVGLGSDPRTDRVLVTGVGYSLLKINIHHILISTAVGCSGEWQFATGTLFKISKH